MDFLDYRTAITIFHLLGVVFGAGGALASDFIFFSSIKDKKISHTEMRFLKLGSKMIWVGLAILVISGALLFATDPDRYLHSGKFLAKMTIVAIIIANGIVFHLVHIPRLHRHAGKYLPSEAEFVRRSPSLIASGAISIISWISALVLGAIRSVPYDYWVIMAFYLGILAFGVLTGFILKKRIF